MIKLRVSENRYHRLGFTVKKEQPSKSLVKVDCQIVNMSRFKCFAQTNVRLHKT
jgi:hypothetical protein